MTMSACTATLGGFDDRPDALVCTGVGHPYGCTFESAEPGDTHVDGGGDE